MRKYSVLAVRYKPMVEDPAGNTTCITETSNAIPKGVLPRLWRCGRSVGASGSASPGIGLLEDCPPS